MRSDENDQVRVQSAFALSEIVFRMGERAAFIVPALIETLLLHEDAEARSCAANVLRAIGPSARSAIPSLLQALQDKHEWVREAAQEALELLEE